MSTRSNIIVEDEYGIFHCRFHHFDGYVVGGLGSTLLKNFPNEADAKFLININKNFESINNSISDIKERESISAGCYDGYCLVEYGGNMIVATNNASLGFDNLKDALRNCEHEFIYVFSQSNKRWCLNWGDDLHIDLSVIHRIESVFKDFTDGVHVKFDEMYSDINKIKSLFHGSKDSANMCLEINNILNMDDNKSIIDYFSNYYGDIIDVENIVDEVKTLNVHDGLNDSIAMPNKKINSKKRAKI